ncbi:MAG: hypothetical protein R6V50_00685 [Thermoplasmatota archaeon]
MKRYVVPLLVVVFCILSFSVHADPSIIISDFSLTPEVLFPGDIAQLQMILTNAETTHTKQTSSTIGGETTVTTQTVSATIERVWLMPAYDGSKKIQSLQTFTTIGNLAPGSSIPLTLQIIADENISSGLYFPIIAVNVEDYQNVRYPIPLKISSETVDLLPNTLPSKISVGGETSITLTVVNNRESSVNSIIVQPNNDENISLSPSAITVGSLVGYEKQEVAFSVKPSQIGVFNLSFSLFYKNGENQHLNTMEFPIEIIQTLDVAPVFYGDITRIPYQGSSRIRLEVFNAKTTSISAVIITPISDDVQVSPSQYFIGSMNPDDVFSVSFDVFSGELPIGNYSMGFKVSFKQGEEYYESPISYKSFQITAAQEKQTIIQPILLYGLIFISILVLIAMLFFIKKRRNR